MFVDCVSLWRRLHQWEGDAGLAVGVRGPEPHFPTISLSCGFLQILSQTERNKCLRHKTHALKLWFPLLSPASSEKNSQPFVVLAKAFPVYLWQPYLRHGYFCFHEAADQQKFSALLNDCIRHLNHGRLSRSLPQRPPFLSCFGQSSVATILKA